MCLAYQRCWLYWKKYISNRSTKLFGIPKIVPTIVPPKQCRKVICHIAKFILFIVYSKDAQNATTTTKFSTPLIEHKKRRERRYCFFTYNGSYTIPCQSQRHQVGGTYSTLLAIGSWQPSTNQPTQLLQQGTQLTKIHIQKTLSPLPRALNAMETISS